MNSRDDVKTFMVACGQTDYNGTEQSDLYFKLIAEEFNELLHAYMEKDIVEVADACADLKWVIEGLEHTLQIPQQEVWDEVARSNLSKISSDGRVLKRADGKVVKPDTYSPPDIAQFFK